MRPLFFGNCEALLSFRVAEAEGRLLAAEFDELVTPPDLANLERGGAPPSWARAGGQPAPLAWRVHPPLPSDPALAADLWRAGARRGACRWPRPARWSRAGRRGRPSWRAAPSTGRARTYAALSRHRPAEPTAIGGGRADAAGGRGRSRPTPSARRGAARPPRAGAAAPGRHRPTAGRAVAAAPAGPTAVTGMATP